MGWFARTSGKSQVSGIVTSSIQSMVLAKLINMNAPWVVNISATAFTMQTLARCIAKPITPASIIDKERIMSGRQELSSNLRDARDQAAAA
ncbi:MAG: hypothetical protein ACREDM_07240 [Methylocella sp.]